LSAFAATADPQPLARALIRCPSVTPKDAGCLDVLEAALRPMGFRCFRLPFESSDSPRVDNLYARLGRATPNFCYAGHTDVVPVGNPAAWTVDPFAAEVIDGVLYGRGAADMKGAIAAFVAGLERYLATSGEPIGSISLLITGDEEGPAVNGTVKVLEWLKTKGEQIDACLVGEPTNPQRLGDMIKIGRRGSLNARLRVAGVQGHVAYPHLADNPVHRLVRMTNRLLEIELDRGTAHFDPSSLQLTSIDVGNPTTNVIPAAAEARFNIRFNDRHSGQSLDRLLRAELDRIGANELAVSVSGESFFTPPGALSDLVQKAVESVLGRRPELSTTGGTSDARFIRAACPVVEFGLVGQTMHKVDERVPLADLESLAQIYLAVLRGYFGPP
jgi:succinyl-diaminopimelate desuccinylase